MKDILILYATITLNTEYVVEKLEENIKKLNSFSVESINIEDLTDFRELKNYKLIIFATSTWSEGEFPPGVNEIIEEIQDSKLDLSNVSFFFIGLGESHYEFFCGALNIAEEVFIQHLNGKKLNENFLIDGPPLDSTLFLLNKQIKEVLKERFSS